MGRDVKPCGTEAAHRRHLRHGEEPCAACKEAHRRRMDRDRRARARPASLAEAAAASGPLHLLGDPLRDRIRRLEENLAIVDAALADATPREVAALSRRRQDLEDAIWRLIPDQSQKGGGVLDELARRRAERTAASAH